MLNIVAAILAAGLLVSTAAQSRDKDPQRLIAQPKAGLPDHEFDRLLSPHGASKKKLTSSGQYLIELPKNTPPGQLKRILQATNHFKFVEEDEKVFHSFAPNDPYFNNETHLTRVNIPQAWDISQGNGITIAILDTGVDSSHQDLAANTLAGYNTFDSSTDSSDVQGHGTAVAGTAAAVINNATGVAGAAGQSKILPIRVTDLSGYGYYSTISQALTYAADRGARVANVSFANIYRSQSISDAASYLRSKGGLTVVAAGNSGANDGSLNNPALIVASATDNNDQRTSWSSYGSYVTIAAPGIVYTTSRYDNYGGWQGTSFSSPLVAGVVADMMAANPGLSPDKVESLLYSTALDIGEPGRDIFYGYGRVDAYAAVAAARGEQPAIDNVAPTTEITAPSSGSTVSGLTPVNATAQDNVKVARVELLADGQTIAGDDSEPFNFTWDTSSVSNGSHNLQTLAYDAAGNTARSALLNVSVNNAVAPPPPARDSTAPTLTITQPSNGQRVSGKVNVASSASDDSGSAGITQQLFINGNLKATAKGSTLAYLWNSQSEKRSPITLMVKATDVAGNVSTQSVQVVK